ncbi:hypothetical protein OGATHE_004098 [Ogataea polymorpha]|uniref:Uncharacterized protein n=1 Tax=Ogataea polymorpha TaxID=460523 RepID=A0A9P8T3V1_9ASCO|nr:hypothetical protein OGATHE_004098 [Ogataea polymorpha]
MWVLGFEKHGLARLQNAVVEQQTSAEETNIVGKLRVQALYQVGKSFAEKLRVRPGSFHKSGRERLELGLRTVHDAAKHFLEQLLFPSNVRRNDSGMEFGNNVIANKLSKFWDFLQQGIYLCKRLESTERLEISDRNSHFRLVVIVWVVFWVGRVQLSGQGLVWMCLDGEHLANRKHLEQERDALFGAEFFDDILAKHLFWRSTHKISQRSPVLSRNSRNRGVGAHPELSVGFFLLYEDVFWVVELGKPRDRGRGAQFSPVIVLGTSNDSEQFWSGRHNYRNL